MTITRALAQWLDRFTHSAIHRGDIFGPSIPLGYLGYAGKISDQVDITTEVDIAELAVTVRVGENRRVKISGLVLWQATGGSPTAIIRVYRGTTLIDRIATQAVGDTFYHTSSGFVYDEPPAGTHVYKLTMHRVIGTGDIDILAGDNYNSMILVEDIGSTLYLGGVPISEIATVYTIYSDVADGYLTNSNAAYANARAGTGTFGISTTGHLFTGQQPPGSVYQCYEAFLSFDTSVIPNDATILTATLYLDGADDQSVTDFTVEARLHDWGATLATTDWVPGADLETKPLLASWGTSDFLPGYNTFTSEPAFLSNINKSGITRMLLCTDRLRLGTTPTTTEYVGFVSADAVDTTADPKLVVEVLV